MIDSFLYSDYRFNEMPAQFVFVRRFALWRRLVPAGPLCCGVILGQAGFHVFAHVLWALAAVAGAALICLLLTRGARFSLRAFFGSFAVVLCWGGVLGVFAASLAWPQREPSNVGGEGSYHAIVLEDPRYRKVGEMELRLALRAAKADTPDTSAMIALCRAIDLPWKNIHGAKAGESLRIFARVSALKIDVNPFSYEATLWRHGVTHSCKIRWATRPEPVARHYFSEAKAWLRGKLEATLGLCEEVGLFLSMSLGVRDVLSSRLEDAFKRTGLSHLLVFSGCQVTLLYGFLTLVLRAVFLRIPRLYQFMYIPGLVSVCAFGATIALVLLVGIEGSSLRAAVAILLFVVAMYLERSRMMLQSVCASLLLMSLIWPGCIFEPGVQLTYAALFGICLGKRSQLEKQTCPRWYEAMRVCCATWVLTSLVVLCWFSTFSCLGLPLNILIASLASLVSCTIGLPCLGLFALGIDPQAWGVQGVIWLLVQMAEMIKYCAGFHWAQIDLEDAGGKIIVAAGLSFILLLLCRRKVKEFDLAYGICRRSAGVFRTSSIKSATAFPAVTARPA